MAPVVLKAKSNGPLYRKLMQQVVGDFFPLRLSCFHIVQTLLAMALSRTSLALLCVCIGLMLLVDVSSAREHPQEKPDATGSATQQQMYLRGNTMGAMTEGTPLSEDNAEGSSDSFSAVDVNDYGSTPATHNCSKKPCKR